MKRKIDDVLKDLIGKATSLSPNPDHGGYKNYIIGEEFIYKIQEYLDSIPKKEENGMSEGLKFCVFCKFFHSYNIEFEGVSIDGVKCVCQHEHATEFDLVTGEKKFLSCELMRSNDLNIKHLLCNRDAVYFIKKEN